MNKFEIGATYIGNSLFGGKTFYTVVNRNEHTLTMKESWIAEDTNNETSNFIKYDILLENGIEKIRIWEYFDHIAYIYANERR